MDTFGARSDNTGSQLGVESERAPRGRSRQSFGVGNSKLLESLAALSASRDRGFLERTILDVLSYVVPAAELGLYRLVEGHHGLALVLAARRIRGKMAVRFVSDLTDPPLLYLTGLPSYEHAIATRKSVAINSAGDGLGPGGCLYIFPLVSSRKVIGAIDLRMRVPLSLDRRHSVQVLTQIYSNQLALLDYAETDSLTGLLNRKVLIRVLESNRVADDHPMTSGARVSPDRRRSHAVQAYLGIIDIDHFKRVNNTFGHVIGDEVLVIFGQAMRASFRETDALFRTGGEEFAVLLRASSCLDATTAFERFRRDIETRPFPRVERITATIGFTAVQRTDFLTDTFERADAALYQGKRSGRNVVCCYEQLVEKGLIQAHQKSADGYSVELF